ncbi:MAG: GlsB/YeaQ/YmgE family stress response membrane protein [Actinomycetota bacterium]|nr:GlsB/YeaQ/YmgE family stress response membrane protein [Actinomycetota bacterium]
MYVVGFAPVSNHHIIAWLFIGLVAGLLAGLVVRGGGLGFVRDIVVGLIGAVIGGLILHAVRGGSHSVVKLWQEIVVAFVGAVILLLVIKFATHGGRRPAGRRR